MGGGHTFQRMILSALSRCESKHEFVVFDISAYGAASSDGIPLVNLREHYLSSIKMATEQASHGPGGLSQMVAVARRIARGLRTRLCGTQPVRGEPSLDSLLSLAVQDHAVEMLWFISPTQARVTVPFIFTVWDLQHRVQPFFPEVSVAGWRWEEREALYREMLPRAALVVTGTEVGREEVLRFYAPHPKSVGVIPFPVPEYEDDPGADHDGNILAKHGLSPGYLFYPAQFWPHKNHVNLLRAVDLLRRRDGLAIDLVFVGSDHGNQRAVQQIAVDLGVQAHFLGFVDAADMPALYRQSGALVYPSFFGPDNLPPLEAFSFGCPVVAAAVDGAAEQLGDAALLFDPADHRALADAIRDLLRDPVLRTSLIERGRARLVGRTTDDYIARVIDRLDGFESRIACWRPGNPPERGA